MLHLVGISLINNFTVDEIVWVDFINGWQNQALGVLAMQDASMHSINEHAFVNVFTSPTSSLVEGVPVISEEQHVEEGDGFITVMIIEDGEYLVFWEHAILVHMEEFLDELGVGVMIHMFFDVVGLSDLSLVLVVIVAKDVLEEAEQVLLLAQKFFVSCKFKKINITLVKCTKTINNVKFDRMNGYDLQKILKLILLDLAPIKLVINESPVKLK